jgi:hypothetical protein
MVGLYSLDQGLGWLPCSRPGGGLMSAVSGAVEDWGVGGGPEVEILFCGTPAVKRKRPETS